MGPHWKSQRKLIYDIGAHRGEDTDFYLKKGVNVVAVEANPDLNQTLKERFKWNLKDGSLVLIEAAIAEDNGEVDFYLNDAVSVWGTIRPDWAERNLALGAPSKRIRVKAVKFSDVLREYGVPYYLKIDIEGADLLCVEALAALPRKPRFVSLESNRESWQGLLREFELFRTLGYNRFKIIDQNGVAHQRGPVPAREGSHVDYHFPADASGLFGEELPGPWMTMDAALKRYKGIFLKIRLLGEFGMFRHNLAVRMLKGMPIISQFVRVSWFDTHATTGTE